MEWEYPYNTQGKRMPYINLMKGNTQNKLKEVMPKNNSRKENVLNVLKE